MPPIPVVLIGAGQRAVQAYAAYAYRRPEELRVMGLAEPHPQSRDAVADEHMIPVKRRFPSWEDLLDAPLMADVAIVTLSGPERVAATISALEAGYHVMVEPPMAYTPADCVELVNISQSTGRMLILGHVLRYTAFYHSLNKIIQSGRVGQILTYTQDYRMPFWMMTHRFVRGEERHAAHHPLMLTVGSHELDLVNWMFPSEFTYVSSVGELSHFRPESAPLDDVPTRCIDGCPIEPECPFSALGIYKERRMPGLPKNGWPLSVVGDDVDTALARDEWGRCVYHADNDVLDHQSVLLQTADGLTATLTIGAHGLAEKRSIRIDGSHGTIHADFFGLDSHITVVDHSSHESSTIKFGIGANGHGGSYGLMGGIVKAIRGEEDINTRAEETWLAHLLAFAAEESRLTNHMIDFTAYQDFHVQTSMP